jgi:hypothetical protein
MPRTPGDDDGPSYWDAIIIVVAIAAFLGLLYLAALSFIR